MSTIDPNRATREHWLNGLGKEDDLTAVETTKVLHEVLVERRRQDQLVAEGKFAWNCGDATVPWAEKLAVLMEEVGEAANEVVEWIITRDKYAADPVLLKMPPHREKYFRDRLRTELIQVAAVCTAWAESLTEHEPEPEFTWVQRSHCGRDPAPIGCCGGTDETCSCECNTCQDPR